MEQTKKRSTVASRAAALVRDPGIQARYDAAGNGKRMRGWNPPGTGPNTAITGLQNIRNRARDSNRNDWAGEAATQKWTTTLLGIGIVPRFKRITNKARKLILTDLWNDWCKTSDADGVLNFYAQQTLAVRAWFESGEVFIRLRPRPEESGLPVLLQIQLIEAEFVPLLDADMWPGLPEGNRIRQGIELNKYGRRIAYWMYKEHPGDNTGNIGSSDLVRVAASQVRHMYEVKRPGQLRGVPAMAPVLAKLREIGDYEDAVLLKQKLSNLFVAFLKQTLPAGAVDVDPLTNLPLQYGNRGEPLSALEPGMIQELDPGQDVVFANPAEAGTTYSDYMRTGHLGTSAGNGLPYEFFSGDIKDVSDRTLRMVVNEFRRFAQQRQWQVIIPMMCEPVVEAWAQAAVLMGLATETEFDALKRAEWSPHGWEHIHPVQDPQGKMMEVASGFRSRSSVIAERGDDPDAVDDERQLDVEREKKLGLWVDPNPPAAGSQPVDDQEDSNKPKGK